MKNDGPKVALRLTTRVVGDLEMARGIRRPPVPTSDDLDAAVENGKEGVGVELRENGRCAAVIRVVWECVVKNDVDGGSHGYTRRRR